ncbi:MAG: peptidylprolyl isomerase [Planctomycetes bacterium]|nr:peptidylprolyl isomerase [Planctomycetota bacterium]
MLTRARALLSISTPCVLLSAITFVGLSPLHAMPLGATPMLQDGDQKTDGSDAPQDTDSRGKTEVPKEKPKTTLLRARHILIPWKGSSAQSTVELTKEEAKKKADEILEKIKGGADFAKLAAAESSCPSKAEGGYLGQFEPDRMVKEFTAAVQAIKDGEVTGPVETQFGWHIIERLPNPAPWPERFAVSHIAISFDGAERHIGTSKRTRDEAKKLATELAAELRAGKRDFAKTASELSDDDNSKNSGGSIGVRRPSDLFPRMSDAIAALKVDEISDPVETPIGFLILRRDAIPEPLGAKHILIMHKAGPGSPSKLTKEEAKAKAAEILAKIKGGEEFDKLAREFSDCPSKSQGGDLGEFDRGRMVPDFEKAVLGAKVGEIVGPIETEFGYHIIMRTK